MKSNNGGKRSAWTNRKMQQSIKKSLPKKVDSKQRSIKQFFSSSSSSPSSGDSTPNTTPATTPDANQQVPAQPQQEQKQEQEQKKPIEGTSSCIAPMIEQIPPIRSLPLDTPFEAEVESLPAATVVPPTTPAKPAVDVQTMPVPGESLPLLSLMSPASMIAPGSPLSADCLKFRLKKKPKAAKPDLLSEIAGSNNNNEEEEEGEDDEEEEEEETPTKNVTASKGVLNFPIFDRTKSPAMSFALPSFSKKTPAKRRSTNASRSSGNNSNKKVKSEEGTNADDGSSSSGSKASTPERGRTEIDGKYVFRGVFYTQLVGRKHFPNSWKMFAQPDASSSSGKQGRTSPVVPDFDPVELLLRRDPHNTFDSNAVEALSMIQSKLGHLPAVLVKWLAPIMDAANSIDTFALQLRPMMIDLPAIEIPAQLCIQVHASFPVEEFSKMSPMLVACLEELEKSITSPLPKIQSNHRQNASMTKPFARKNTGGSSQKTLFQMNLQSSTESLASSASWRQKLRFTSLQSERKKMSEEEDNVTIVTKEILKMIFLTIGTEELFHKIVRVCKYWKEIVTEFMPFRRRYFLISRPLTNGVAHMPLNGMESLRSLKEFVEYLSQIDCPISNTIAPYIIDRLLTQQQVCVINLLTSKISNSCKSSFLVVFMLSLMLMPDVSSMIAFIEKLAMNQFHGITKVRIVDAVYLFCHLLRVSPVSTSNSRLWYDFRVLAEHYHTAFRKFDNDLCLTDEQLAIVQTDLRGNDTLKIIAFAGTGKTSTLVVYARCRPSTRFLYLSFNVSVKEEGTRRFPPNVVSNNIHALAKAKCYMYSHKFVDQMTQAIAMKALKISAGIAAPVVGLLEGFFRSKDDQILDCHIRETGGCNRQKLIKLANDLWTKMKDVGNLDAKMVHSGYLKLYHLTRPKLHEEYDFIFLDEFQDCNEVISDIILSQNCPKIVVGDPHQQIYGFTGALASMEKVQATHVMYLSQSFRLGSNISYLAYWLLKKKKNEQKVLIGANGDGTIFKARTRFLEHIGQQSYAYIARTNFSLAVEAIKICHEKQDDDKFWISFIGGAPPPYCFQLIDNVYQTRIGKTKFKRYNRWVDYETLRNSQLNRDEVAALYLAETYRDNLPRLLEQARKRMRKFEDVALLTRSTGSSSNSGRNGSGSSDGGIVLTTVHKAKGLEFDHVQLSDDFATFSPTNNSKKADLIEEFNILYVAITRAKKTICLNSDLIAFLNVNAVGMQRIGFVENNTAFLGGICGLCEAQFAPRIVVNIDGDDHAQSRLGYCLAQTGEPVCTACGSCVLPLVPRRPPRR